MPVGLSVLQPLSCKAYKTNKLQALRLSRIHCCVTLGVSVNVQPFQKHRALADKTHITHINHQSNRQKPNCHKTSELTDICLLVNDTFKLIKVSLLYYQQKIVEKHIYSMNKT